MNPGDDYRKTILCVDDEKDILAVLKRILKILPYQVLTAEDGDEAIKIAVTKKPNLIFLDVNMPKRNGYEVLNLLKQMQLGDIPVVLLSALDSKEAKTMGIKSGCNLYITKPFDREKVINTARYFLEGKNE